MTDTSNLKMMRGSEGRANYVVVGRVGPFAIGLKPDQVQSARAHDIKGHTWFHYMLRIAPHPEDFFDDMPLDSNVVPLVSKDADPGSVLDHIDWSKSDPYRASTHIGILIKGDIADGMDGAEIIVSQLASGVVGQQMESGLRAFLGDKVQHIKRGVLSKWLNTIYETMADTAMKSVKYKHSMKTSIENSNGGVVNLTTCHKQALEYAGIEFAGGDLTASDLAMAQNEAFSDAGAKIVSFPAKKEDEAKVNMNTDGMNPSDDDEDSRFPISEWEAAEDGKSAGVTYDDWVEEKEADADADD